MKKSFEIMIDDGWAGEYRRHEWGIRNYISLVYSYGFYVVIAGAIAYFILASMGVQKPLLNVGVVVAVQFFIASFWYWISMIQALRKWDDWLREHAGKPIKWHVDDEGIALEYPTGTATSKWHTLSSIECYVTLWNLGLDNISTLIPVQFIDSEFENFLRELVDKGEVVVTKREYVFPEETELPKLNEPF